MTKAQNIMIDESQFNQQSDIVWTKNKPNYYQKGQLQQTSRSKLRDIESK
jgi:hypothetical protein